MSAPKAYNGHHCWNCWNVALWIANDERLYRAALACRAKNKRVGAGLFIRDVVGEGARTPDGALYTFKAVRAALAGLE